MANDLTSFMSRRYLRWLLVPLGVTVAVLVGLWINERTTTVIEQVTVCSVHPADKEYDKAHFTYAPAIASGFQVTDQVEWIGLNGASSTLPAGEVIPKLQAGSYYQFTIKRQDSFYSSLRKVEELREQPPHSKDGCPPYRA